VREQSLSFTKHLDVRADRNGHYVHNLRDCPDHGVAIDLFGVLISLGVRNPGARDADRTEAGLLELSRARSVSRVRQQQPADAVLLAKPRSTQCQ
jgi:hypothetical protein